MKLKIQINRDNRDKMADLFLIFLLSKEFLRIFFGRCLGVFGLASYSSLVTGIVVFAPFIIYYLLKPKMSKSIALALLFIFLLVCFFGISYIVHPSYGKWYLRKHYGVWDAVFSPLSGSIYTILVFAMIRDTERIIRDFKYISVLQFLTCLYQIYSAMSRGYWEAYNASGEIIESTYNVDFGYKAAFVGLLFFMYFILEKRKLFKYICLGLSIISASWVIIYGSRGSIFTYGIGLILFLGYRIRILSKIKQIFVWICSILGVAVVYSFYNTLIDGIYALLSMANINSRTIIMILNGNFMDENGRDSISNLAMELIRSQSLLGSGAYGDRPVIGPHYYWGYCHNLVLEFLVDFGVVIGVLLLCMIAVGCIRYYFRCNDWKQTGIFVAIFSMNMKLFFSDTFWGFSYFWLLISLLLFMNRDISRKMKGLRLKEKRKKAIQYQSTSKLPLSMRIL